MPESSSRLPARPSAVLRATTWVVGALVLLAAAARPAAAVPTFKTINVDGDLSDWDEIVTNPSQTSLDGDGSVVPCPFSTDLDCPVQSAGRDLRVFAWTYDSSFLFVYLKRQGSSSNDQTFWFYLDLDDDQLMGAGDRVLRIRYNGSTGLTQNSLFPYLPDDPGGDPMVDGLGRADGWDMPGDCDSTPTWSEGVPNGGTAEGDGFEERIPWSALGVAPGSGLYFHVGSSNSPNPSNVSSQVDDNMGGLGGGIGTLGFDLVRVDPDNQGTVADGSRVQYSHLIVNAGTRAQAYTFNVESSLGLSATIWRDRDGDGIGDDLIGTDANGDGDFADAGDSLDPAWDTDLDGLPETTVLRPGEEMAVVIELQTRAGQQDQRDVTVLAAWLAGSQVEVSESATDITDIGDMVVLSDQAKRSVAGQNVSYPVSVCNNGGPNLFDMLVTSSAGSQIDLYSDPECDQVANDFLARDREGDASWDVIPDPPTTDTDSDGLPDTGVLSTGRCACYVLQVRMNASAPLGSQDVVVFTARGNFPLSSGTARLITTIAERLEVSPDFTFALGTEKFSGPDASVFFPHVARNNWLLPDSVEFSTRPPTNSEGWAVQIWSDPDGDGNISDGEIIRETDPIPANGGERHFIVEVIVPPDAADGTRASTAVTATSSSSPATFDAVTDELEVSTIATFSDPLFTVSEAYFPPCATVFAEGTGLGRPRDDIYDLVWRRPDGIAGRFHDPFFPDAFGVATDSFAPVGTDALGTWTLELRRDTLTIDSIDFVVEGVGLIEGLATDRTAYPMAGQPLMVSARLGNGNVRATLPASTIDYVVLDPAGTSYLRSGAPSTFQPYTGVEVTRSSGVPSLLQGETFPDSFTVPNVTYSTEGLHRVVATWRAPCGAVLGQASVAFVAGIGEDCGNGTDDDGDTLADCDDASCALDPRCHEIECLDGIDSDGDTVVDCDDPDCFGDINCPERDCGNGADDDLDTLVDCDDPDCGSDPACHEQDCGDGLDDDGDTLVDCADPDCVASGRCPEIDCTNGTDDDGDTLADCLDSDCALDPACYEVDCADGIDNDSDGDVDCDDADCRTRPPCNVPEDCTNGVDDDGDTLADCGDLDCAGEPACADTDGDTVPDAIDCADTDPTAFAVPPEVPRLDVTKPVGTDARIAWTNVRVVSGTSTVYDVITGGIRQLWTDRGFASASCLAMDAGTELANDARPAPGVSDGFWYLVEGESSACGAGGYGSGSLGPRVIPAGLCE